MSDRNYFPIHEINPHLICVLCSGYLIDATTIAECLHTFCKSCIVRYFESSQFCPICDVQVHKTDPLLSIRPDSVLQKLVYKLAPKIHHREMARRKKFYASNTKVNPVSLEDAGHDINRKYILPEDIICLALRPMLGAEKFNEEVPTRYFKCPASIKISQLMKLIIGKFDLPKEHPVAIYAEQSDRLPVSMSLLDVAYMQYLQRKELMVLYYKIFFSKRIKFEKEISIRPGIFERNKQLITKVKPLPIEPIPKKSLLKIAPVPPRNGSDASRLGQMKITSVANINSLKAETCLPTHKAILPLGSNPSDIITLNPYSISQPNNLTNSYGISVLPICSPAMPAVLSNNIINSFTVGGTVLPMGITLGTNLICPSLTNPVFNQNITNIDLSSAPFVSDGSQQSFYVQTSSFDTFRPIPIKTEDDCESGKGFFPKTNKLSHTVTSDNRDREVQMTISEAGVMSFKSDGAASGTESLLKPIKADACELLSQIETSNLIDSEDYSKEYDILSNSDKFSKIKQVKPFVTENLMKTRNDGVIGRIDENNSDIISELVPTTTAISIEPIEGTAVQGKHISMTESITASLSNRTQAADTTKRKFELFESKLAIRKIDRPAAATRKICNNNQIRRKKVKSRDISNTLPPKRAPAIGYKTLKSSVRGWYPKFPREEILKNSTLDRTTNKFFKSRNHSLLRIANQPTAVMAKSIRFSSALTSNIGRSKKPNKLANLTHPVNHNSQSKIDSLKLSSSISKHSVSRSRTNSDTSATDNTNIPIKTKNSAINFLAATHIKCKNDGRRFSNTIVTCCSEDKITTPTSIIELANRQTKEDTGVKSAKFHGNVSTPPSKARTEVSPISIESNPNSQSTKNKTTLPSLNGPSLIINSDKRVSHMQNRDKHIAKSKLYGDHISSPPKQYSLSRVKSRKGEYVEKVKASPPTKRCTKLESVSSLKAYNKHPHTLQAISSLIPSSSNLRELHDSRQPIGLAKGFDKFAFKKLFPTVEIKEAASYPSGICSNVFKSLRLQTNSLSSPDVSLLTSQDSLASHLLGMNFQNPSASFIRNSFMGLAGTSAQGLNSPDYTLMALWLQSREAREVLLSCSSSLSPTSPIATTPSVNLRPGAITSAKTRNSSDCTKDKIFQKEARDIAKDCVMTIKIAPSCDQNEANISGTSRTQNKPEHTVTPTCDSPLLSRTPSITTEENVNHPSDESYLSAIIKMANSQLPRKTESPKVLSSQPTKPNAVALAPDVCCSPQCNSSSISQIEYSHCANSLNKDDTSAISGSDMESFSKAATVQLPACSPTESLNKSVDSVKPLKLVRTIDDSIENGQDSSLSKAICGDKIILDAHQTNTKVFQLDSTAILHIESDTDYESSSRAKEVSKSQLKSCFSTNENCPTAHTEKIDSILLLEMPDETTKLEPKPKTDNNKFEWLRPDINKLKHSPQTDTHDSTDISRDLLNVTLSDPCPSYVPPSSKLNPFEICSSDDVTEKEIVGVPKYNPVDFPPKNLPICSTPKKEESQVSTEASSLAAINVSNLNESRNDKEPNEIDQTESESFSSSETSLRLVMDEGIFNTIETTSLEQDSIKAFDLHYSLQTKLTNVNEQQNTDPSLPQNLLTATPTPNAVAKSLDDGFALLNSAEKDKLELTSNSIATADLISAAGSEPTHSDPILLLNEQFSKRASELDVTTYPKTAPPSNVYGEGAHIGASGGQKPAAIVQAPKYDAKTANAVNNNNKYSARHPATMNNLYSTDEFLQQLQSMTFPQMCSSTPHHKAGPWAQQAWNSSNNSAYDYACHQKNYTLDTPQTGCQQQYGFRVSSASSKTSLPIRAAQFSYNSNNYEQQQKEPPTKKATAATAQNNYCDMQSSPQTMANPKNSYPLHPFSNCDYNSNYANFFTNNTAQSPNLSSLMSSVGYNFNFPNAKMFSGQQSSYLGLNQASSANNYISGTYGNNSGSNYHNSMNNYGFGNSNVNSNLGGSLHNFHFPYHNYNSYSHLYQGENSGLIAHHPSSLMPSFAGPSRGSLSPRNAVSSPQPFNDLSLQSSFFPVMPFASGLPGSALGSSSPASIHTSKTSGKASRTTKSSQRNKARKGAANGRKIKKTSVDPKTNETLPSGSTMLCPSTYPTNMAASCADIVSAGPSLDHHHGAASKNSHQMEQRSHYHMPHPPSNPILYPHGSNSLLFDPSTSNTTSKLSNNKQFSTDFPINDAVYNTHINPNCGFHRK